MASSSAANPGDAPLDPASAPPAIVCVGMAGSGKTTFMRRINSYLHSKNRPPYVINLDPAVLNVPFEANIDIRDSVNYEEVMKQYNLGPNGGILTSLNLFATKVDQIVNLLEKRARPNPAAAEPQKPDDGSSNTTSTDGKKQIDSILVDTPGQIEVFVWSASGTILLESLASSFPTIIAYIIDTPRTASTSTFMSNMLYACSILYKTKLPMILVFNKTDVKDAAFAKEWMTDFEAFQAALRRDEEGSSEDGGGGAPSHGGSGYMGSLLNSMSLMLEEFYSHLSVVGVSSRLGTGMEEFFDAVEDKRKEFLSDYLPELQRRRVERDEARKKSRDKELDKMMQGMSVGGTAGGNTNDDDDDDDDVEVASDDNDYDYDSEDDAVAQREQSLQERYRGAMGENDDSIVADASFAKYLHTQK